MIGRIYFIVHLIILLNDLNPSDAKRPSKIRQGSSAAPGEFPYMVSIKYGNKYICNGAIISSQQILTAAHCFIGYNSSCIEEFIVITGATKNRAVGKVHKVSNVAIHRKFKSDEKYKWRDDIAVVTLADTIMFDHFQNSIALPNTNPQDYIVAILLGWGNTWCNDEESECLKETKVAVLTNKECNEKYPRIMATQMCGFNGKGTGFCNDNSGSPLVYNNEVIGIISSSASCEAELSPTIYTRVDKYIDFISQVIATT